MYVYPRLSEGAARSLLEEYAELDPIELRKRAQTSHQDAAPVAVGGTGVPESSIDEVAVALRELADRLGFPESLSRARIGDFDRPATALLHQLMAIVPSDAASDEVWNFLSLVVFPDLSVWRFPERAENRMLGRPRNVLRRLWWRAEIVGADLIDRSDGLGEDELVNIMERPTLAADRRLARSMAGAILRAPNGSVSRSELMRDFAKRMLRAQGAFCLDVLSNEDLDSVVQRELQQAIAAMTGKPVVEVPPLIDPVVVDAAHPVLLQVEIASEAAASSWTKPYERGEAHGKASPANCRFRPDSPLATLYLTRYFEMLIEKEAPVHIETLFDAFQRDWEVDPYVGDMPEALDRALRRCSVWGQRVELSADGFVRLPGQTLEQVRVPSHGDVRVPSRVPPEEIRLAIFHLRREHPGAGQDVLAGALWDLFGWTKGAVSRRFLERVGLTPTSMDG
ncbi:hypothetical protein ACI78Q_21830 [Geodermatophilus sp. SYSU D00705]